MIVPALEIICSELKKPGVEIDAELLNISDIISGNGDNGSNADVIVTLINIEENRISRDPRNFLKRNNEILLKNPAVHLNLTILFSSVKTGTAYGTALLNIQKVIRFFQNKFVFDHVNTPGLDDGIEKLVLEMVTLSFDQLNQLWTILGSKYQPSVVYKMMMISIDSVSDQRGVPITEIDTNYYQIKPDINE